jgi:hypothetical protein
LAGQKRIELAYSCLENRAFLLIIRLVYVVVCLEITNRRSRRSRAVGNMAPAAGRNTKSTAEAETALAETALAKTALAETALAETALAETALAETALVSTSLWHSQYLA